MFLYEGKLFKGTLLKALSLQKFFYYFAIKNIFNRNKKKSVFTKCFGVKTAPVVENQFF